METEIVKIPNNFFGIWQHRLTIICRIPIETVAYFWIQQWFQFSLTFRSFTSRYCLTDNLSEWSKLSCYSAVITPRSEHKRSTFKIASPCVNTKYRPVRKPRSKRYGYCWWRLIKYSQWKDLRYYIARNVQKIWLWGGSVQFGP